MALLNMLEWNVLEDISITYLERILPREALVAVIAGERLDSQMYPLVSLQVMVAIETLWALVAFEWSIICSWLLVGRVTKEMRHGRCMATVETGHHSRMNAYQRKLTVGVLDVGENRRLVGWVC
jgi:hypothetical protein